MNVGGGYILTADQVAAWQEAYPDEYAEFVDAGLFDEDTNALFDFPSWMIDDDPATGPFDIALNPSHGTSGW